MAKIDNATIAQFRDMASEWLAAQNYANCDVLVGSDAWFIAGKSGILDICYGNTAKDIPGIPDCCDGHIQTALQAVFPNCVFRDAKWY